MATVAPREHGRIVEERLFRDNAATSNGLASLRKDRKRLKWYLPQAENGDNELQVLADQAIPDNLAPVAPKRDQFKRLFYMPENAVGRLAPVSRNAPRISTSSAH